LVACAPPIAQARNDGDGDDGGGICVEAMAVDESAEGAPLVHATPQGIERSRAAPLTISDAASIGAATSAATPATSATSMATPATQPTTTSAAPTADVVMAPDEATIDAAVEAAMFHAAGVKSLDEHDFNADSSIWPSNISVADREAAWMRKEMSQLMRNVGVAELPSACDGFKVNFRRPCIERRSTGPAATCRKRPRIYNYVVDGCCGYVVNFASKESALAIAENGLGCVPCGNPSCTGKDGKWRTTPTRFSFKSAAPMLVVEPDGLPAPMVCAWSTCEDCGKPFSHLNSVTLRRLLDVPEVLAPLPFDPEFPFSDVYLHRVHTSELEYDAVARQGALRRAWSAIKSGAAAMLSWEGTAAADSPSSTATPAVDSGQPYAAPPPRQPYAAPPPLEVPPVAAPLQLEQAPSINKRRRSDDPAAAKAQNNKRSKSNPWWCTCRPVWPQISGGNPRHVPACPREVFSQGGDAARMPVIGEIVTCMQGAGPRAGQRFRCVRVQKNGWEKVED
jgi:hypothetical protein